MNIANLLSATSRSSLESVLDGLPPSLRIRDGTIEPALVDLGLGTDGKDDVGVLKPPVQRPPKSPPLGRAQFAKPRAALAPDRALVREPQGGSVNLQLLDDNDDGVEVTLALLPD
jgi:hypothetical protein